MKWVMLRTRCRFFGSVYDQVLLNLKTAIRLSDSIDACISLGQNKARSIRQVKTFLWDQMAQGFLKIRNNLLQ
jgi:hypothetical protein